MRLRFKRWTYRFNGHQITVECAFSLFGWSQERLLVDGQERTRSGGWWRLNTSLDAWLDDEVPPTGLRAVLSPGFLTVHCFLWAHGAPVLTRERSRARIVHTARGAWPERSLS